MNTAIILLLEREFEQIRRALCLLKAESALVSVAIGEDRDLVATIEVDWLRAIADVVHEDDPILAKRLRQLLTKKKKEAAVEWLRSKFGL